MKPNQNVQQPSNSSESDEPRIPGTEREDKSEAVETEEAKAKRMKKARKDYDLHVAMVASTEDVETAEAKFLVWYEGRDGLRRRLGLPPEVAA